ncbi:winged helix-turn-helix domain-containing protein [Saccharopolyspora thermophila]|uniref:HTH gntR-type domain-containing protein n=1 Tax=Saccharopolyspora thermophila TaxID=89367 RepID=A0ABP3N9H7_9PSEU
MGLDPEDKRPAYQQVADNLRRMIVTGELAPGDQLPSISALREEYGISPMTARAAIKELSSAGLVVVRQGQGAFVLEGAAAKTDLTVDDLAELFQQLSAAVETLTQRVAEIEAKLPADQEKTEPQGRKRGR